MSLLDYVMEAKKTPKINVKTETPKGGDDAENDFSTGIPEDPDVTPENNEGEAPEENEPGTGVDYGQDLPNADDDEGEDNTTPEDDDYSANVPTADEDEPAENPPANDTGGGGGINVNATETQPTEQPADAGGGDDFGAGMPAADDAGETDPNASPAPADNPDGSAISVGGDTGNPAPADPNQGAAGGDDFGAGMPSADDAAGDPNAAQQPGDQQQAQDPNAPNTAGGDQGNADPNDPNAQQGAEGEDGDDMGDGLDGMSNANSFSDAADNGENPQQMTDNDKKNNVIILRHAYVNLYNEVASFLRKLENTRKDSLLSIVTYNQVKENLTQLREYIVNYISIYYDTNEYEINLFNFEYFIQIMRVNARMIKVMKEGNKKLNYLTVEDKKNKKSTKSKKSA